jgi:uncharacterized protein (DUF58 family)
MAAKAQLPSVYLRRLESLQLRARKSFLGNRHGGHQSLRRGHGLEFSDYRKYEAGDNPRHIDWGLYGRSDRLYVKRFREEQALNTLFIADASASMFVPEGDQKWRAARELCLSLAYIALMQNDSVRVAVPGAFLSAAASHPRAFRSLQDMLCGVSSSQQEAFAKGVEKAAAAMRFPGLCVLVSDLLFPPEEIFHALDALRARNLDIHLFQVIGASDVDPFHEQSQYIAVDSETGQEIPLQGDARAREEYREQFLVHQAHIRQYCARYGIFFDSFAAKPGAQEYVLSHLVGKGMLKGA